MFTYPDTEDLRQFTEILTENNFAISKYLPPLSTDWYVAVMDCIEYVQSTAQYEENDIYEESAKLLYKVVKKHELADSNKRSSIMAVVLFCLLNDYMVTDPVALKRQAKRLAKSKGRRNELLMRRRVAECLKEILAEFAAS